MHLLIYWTAPLLWMALIFWFSTDRFSGAQTGALLASLLARLIDLDPETIEGINFVIRKAAHFCSYAILAALFLRAFRGRSLARWRASWALSSLLLTGLYGLFDEYHQSLTAHRTASLSDSLLDLARGAAAVLLWREKVR